MLRSNQPTPSTLRGCCRRSGSHVGAFEFLHWDVQVGTSDWDPAIGRSPLNFPSPPRRRPPTFPTARASARNTALAAKVSAMVGREGRRASRCLCHRPERPWRPHRSRCVASSDGHGQPGHAHLHAMHRRHHHHRHRHRHRRRHHRRHRAASRSPRAARASACSQP